MPAFHRSLAIGTVATAFVALLLLSSWAQNTNAGTWRTGQSDEFRYGFIDSLAREKMDIIILGPYGKSVQEGFSKCLAGQTDILMLRIVDAYLDRNPTANT
jgi:hypothetical protein